MTYSEIKSTRLDESCTVEEYFRDGWESRVSFVFGSRQSLFAYLLRRGSDRDEDVRKSRIICPYGGGSWVWEPLNLSRERVSLWGGSSSEVGYDLYHLTSFVRPDFSAWLFARLMTDEVKLRRFTVVMMYNYRYRLEKYNLRLVFGVMHWGEVSMGRVLPLHFHFLFEHRSRPGSKGHAEARQMIWERFNITL